MAKKIVVIEDNPDDLHLLNRCLRNMDISPDVTEISNVSQAIDYLTTTVTPPSLVLVDYNMSTAKDTGLDVIREVKKQDRYKYVPFVFMSISMGQDKMRLALDAGANSCIIKPVEFEKWNRTVKRVLTYWLEVDQSRDSMK